MKYKLYIRDKEIELSEQDLILFTYQKSDVTSPTAIKTSYTKTLTVPGTPKNNAAFDVIYKLDRYQTGASFNPSKREPFQLFLDGTMIESGYVKMDKLNISNNYVTYEITLYSNLADLFYGLQTGEDGNQLTFSDLDLNICFRINATTVYNAWNKLANKSTTSSTNRVVDNSSGATANRGGRNTNIPGRDATTGSLVINPSSSMYDIINFAPAYNGLPENDNFDSDKILVNVNAYMPNSKSSVINRFEDGTATKTGWTQSIVDGKVTYKPFEASSGEKYALVSLPQNCTEWEMHDLRSYMQRPVLKVKELIASIIRYAKETLGYTIELDTDFFNSSNKYYSDAWISLSLLSEIDSEIQSGDIVASKKGAAAYRLKNFIDIFQNSPTPLDFITSWAKLFNLYFDYSKTEKKVKIMMMKNYYKSGIINIDKKIDRSSITACPIINYDFKYLDLSYAEGSSEILEDYHTAQSIDYGTLRFYTGYDFDNGIKTEPDNLIFKNAADVLEKSSYFRMIESIWTAPTVGYHPYPFFMNKIGTEYSLFSSTTNSDGLIEYDTKSVEIEKYVKSTVNARKEQTERYFLKKIPYRIQEGQYANDEYYDSFPKPQFHSDDNKASDGSNVLLFFNKMVSPQTRYPGGTNGDIRSSKYDYLPYFLTDDVVADGSGYVGERTALDGSSCWLFPEITKGDGTSIGAETYGQYTMFNLPMFNRYKSTEELDSTTESYTYTIDYSFDIDTPKQIYVPKYVSNTDGCISKKFSWNEYLSDIYNVNTRVVECYVDLEIITDALRRFYYFDNSYWIITKISDYVFGNNIVKVTFLKVNDTSNYLSSGNFSGSGSNNDNTGGSTIKPGEIDTPRPPRQDPNPPEEDDSTDDSDDTDDTGDTGGSSSGGSSSGGSPTPDTDTPRPPRGEPNPPETDEEENETP